MNVILYWPGLDYKGQLHAAESHLILSSPTTKSWVLYHVPFLSYLSPKQRSQYLWLLSKLWTKQGLLRYRHDWHSTCHQARAKNLTSVVLFTFNVALASIFGQKNFKSVRYLSLIPLVKSYVTHFPKFHCAQKMCIKSSSKILKLKHSYTNNEI